MSNDPHISVTAAQRNRNTEESLWLADGKLDENWALISSREHTSKKNGGAW